MSFDSLLINTGTVKRYTTGAANDYGRSTKTWADHLVNQKCRLMEMSGPEAEIRIGAEVVIAGYKVFCKNIDVIESDRWVIDGVTYEILKVNFHQDSATKHHKECYVRTVK
jgi:hypothetical protein